MDLSFTQAEKTMDCKTKISRVPSRARAHALFDRACVCGTRSLILNAAVILAVLIGVGAGNVAWGQTPTTLTATTSPQQITSTGEYVAPAGYRIVKIECWGGGGSGQREYVPGDNGGGGNGGGGGGYAGVDYLDLASDAVINVTGIGEGGASIDADGVGNPGSEARVKLKQGSDFVDLVYATGGAAGGNSGTGGTGWIQSGRYGRIFSGGNGGTRNSSGYSGGGGGGAGSNGNGSNGSAPTYSWGSYSGGDGGDGGSGNGGDGGNGRGDDRNGSVRGGGGGGSYSTPSGAGAAGGVWITLTTTPVRLQATTSPQIIPYSGEYYAPQGYRITKIECWGGGGAGSRSDYGGYGGGGGGYVGGNVKNIPAGEAGTVTVSIGMGGASATTANSNGGDGYSTSVIYNNFSIVANGGGGGKTNAAGAASTNGSWSGSTYQNGSFTRYNGGTGGSNRNYQYSGSGGTGAGYSSNGYNGNRANTNSSASRRSGRSSNPGPDQGYGGAGANGNNNAEAGGLYGGGGGGSQYGNSGAGAPGCVRITLAEDPKNVVVSFDANVSPENANSITWRSGSGYNITSSGSYTVASNQRFRSNSTLFNYGTDYMDNCISRVGYEFLGWSTVSGEDEDHIVNVNTYLNTLTDEINWDATPNPTLKLYAQWKPQKNCFYLFLTDSRIAMNDADYLPGGDCSSKFTSANNSYYFEVEYDSKLDTNAGWQCLDNVNVPTGYSLEKNGSTATGWYFVDNTGTINRDANGNITNTSVTDNTVWNTSCPNQTDNNGNIRTHIRAVWKPNEYTVTFDPNKPSDAAEDVTLSRTSQPIIYGTAYDSLPIPICYGFVFRAGMVPLHQALQMYLSRRQTNTTIPLT